jgi:hypothetical protein
MGSFCNSSPTATQTNAPNPEAMSAYQGILGRAQQVASTPYQAYTGQLTAGLDPTQQAGIANINQSYGMAQPYFQQASQYAQQGAAPVANISGADIQNYYNPYQQAVINATMGNINEADQRQQQQVKGNAAMAGALGGDRQAVAQAELARQQGLARNQTLAGLQSQGYNQAFGAAQSQQANQQQNAQRAANAAYAYGQLGTGAQGAQLQGAGAQLGAGAVAQQNAQAALNAQYGQFQQQQAFPYQQLGWLAGVTAPIAGAMGGTQTTTPATPSPFSQFLGLGMAGLGALGKAAARGGRIGYADGGSPYGGGAGGSPYGNIDYGRGYVPQVQISAAHPMQFTSVPYKSQPQSTTPSSGSISQAISGGKNLYSMFGGAGAEGLGTAGTEGFSGTAGGEAAPIGINYGPGGAGASTPGFMSGISDMFSGTAPAVSEGAGEAMSGLGASASEWGPAVAETAGEWGPAVAETAGEWGPALAETASEWGPVIAETAAEWGPAIAESAAEWGPLLFALVKDGGRINGAPQRKRYANGGFVDTVHEIRNSLRSYQEGGSVFGHRPIVVMKDDNSSPFPSVMPSRRGYQDGGDVEMPFNDRWAPVAGGLPEPGVLSPTPVRTFDAGNWSPQQVSPQAMANWRGAADLTGADSGAPVSPAVQLPPEITAGASRPAPQMPADAMAYDRPSPMAPPVRGDQQPSQGGFLGFLDSLRPTMTQEQKAGLMAAGLATAAGTSPFGMSNIGAGGLEGMRAMAGVRKEELAKAASQRNADAEARKLMHDLRRDSIAEQQFEQRRSLEERKLEELKAQHRMPKVMTDENGLPILVDPLSGKIVGRPNAPAEQQPQAPLKPGEVRAEEEQGIIPANAKLVQGGAYNYKDDAPYIEKGMDVPEPQGVAGRSQRTLQTDAEYYLQTGKLPTVRGGKSPVAIQDTQYKRAVQNYAGALAQSRGVTPEQSAEMWRTAPGMLRFVLGADGRSTVAMGTAIRHLDTLENLYKAMQMEKSGGGDIQLINKWKAEFSRQFGYPSVEALRAARQIVGAEIIKGLGVAGGGTKEEREQASAAYAERLSPDQFAATKSAVQELLGGQLEGRERQAANAGVSKDRFKNLVGDRPYDLLTKAQNKGEKSGEPKFTGRTATGPGGKKLRETSTGDWVP